jgi:hypothetical protein
VIFSLIFGSLKERRVDSSIAECILSFLINSRSVVNAFYSNPQ